LTDLELVFGLGPVRLDVLSMGSCVWVDEVHGVVDGLVVQVDLLLVDELAQTKKWGLWKSRYLPYTGNHLHVDKRDAATLLPIIQKVPGSTVVSDQWAAWVDEVHGVVDGLVVQVDLLLDLSLSSPLV
jgi:hypothetical protein